MPKQSAGILLYRRPSRNGGGGGGGASVEVLLVHPGGPFWAKKDLGAWSVPKGEIKDDEEALAAAQREFEEEVGVPARGIFLPLTPVRQKSGKVIRVWAVEGDVNPTDVRSNTFPLEWPPSSGKTRDFPEVDRAEWFTLNAARTKILPGQLPFISELATLLRA